MSEIKIKTDVAGRVCSIPAAIGASLNDGDEILLVEAMKMEIPVTAPGAGKLTSILVKVDDIIAEQQVVAIIEG